MPGPGGGSHGGGFGGGSHGGGGFGGGGFGGGHGGGFGGPHGHMHMHMGWGPWFFHPFYMPGWGCVPYMFGSIICLVLCAVILLSVFGGAVAIGVTDIASGGSIQYDEATFQEYANDQYFKVFGSEKDTEDEILVVFITTETYDGYYCIAWVGDHIVKDVNYMFGNEETEFGKSVQNNIDADYYKFSFTSQLANVFDDMTAKAKEVVGEGSYFTKEACGNASFEAKVVNNTDLTVSENLTDAMQAFTTETGIPCAVVIDYEDAVLPSVVSTSSYISVGIAAVFLIFGGWLAVRNFKLYKKAKEEYNG